MFDFWVIRQVEPKFRTLWRGRESRAEKIEPCVASAEGSTFLTHRPRPATQGSIFSARVAEGFDVFLPVYNAAPPVTGSAQRVRETCKNRTLCQNCANGFEKTHKRFEPSACDAPKGSSFADVGETATTKGSKNLLRKRAKSRTLAVWADRAARPGGMRGPGVSPSEKEGRRIRYGAFNTSITPPKVGWRILE